MKCGGFQWPQKNLQSGIELEVNIYIDVISNHIEALCMDPRSQVKKKNLPKGSKDLAPRREFIKLENTFLNMTEYYCEYICRIH